MSLVEHLTGCLEQSQCREKAALQRCSELEVSVSNEVSAASRRAYETSPPVFFTSAGSLDAADSPDAKERSETPPAVFVEVEELRKQIQEQLEESNKVQERLQRAGGGLRTISRSRPPLPKGFGK